MFRKLHGSRASSLAFHVVKKGSYRPALCSYQSMTSHQNSRSFSNESFKDTLRRVQENREKTAAGEKVGESAEEGESKNEKATGAPKAEEASKINVNELRHKAFVFIREAKSVFTENLNAAWGEMTGSSRESVLEKKFEQSTSFKRAKKDSDDDVDGEGAAAPEYTGPSALVIVPAAKSYWEQMASRLDAPIIREILKGAKIYTKAAADTNIGQQAQKATQNVRDKIEDAREFWETSQNPIIHTLSGVWENMTGDTEEGLTIAEIRKKDPTFIKENWTEEVKRTLAPLVIKAHLEGDFKALKPWLTEGVYSRLAAEMRTRKADGIYFDSNILEIDENTVILRFLEGGGPVILVVYMVQQINCIRNKAGEVIEGAESEVRAKFYSIAFQQVYEEIDGDENNAILKWKVVDYQLAGDVAYY